jgi:hypothetical protein
MDGLAALRTLWREFNGPPIWGISDCCQLAARYVKLRTGIDHAPKFPYQTKVEALRLLTEHGGVINLIAHCIGPSHADPQPWDLVAVDTGDGWLSTGIYNGAFVLAIHPDHGLIKMLPRHIRAAWSL